MVIVHPRVAERHDDLQEEDVISAWENAITCIPRLQAEPTRYIAVGADAKGRLIEMVAQLVPNGTWVIFHAMTPPSRNTLIETNMIGRL